MAPDRLLYAGRAVLVTKPLGLYLVAVYDGRVRWLAPVERATLPGVPASIPSEDQHWTRYAAAHAALQRWCRCC